MKTSILASIAVAVWSASAFAALAAPSAEAALRTLTKTYDLAQSSCPSGLRACAAGSYGPGGCYKPGFATCTAGLVCTGGTMACKPSNGAAAYCYAPNTGNCQ